VRAEARAAPPARPAFVLGTAGHIDHGKTALVRALTGVDTDRLPEEKARGITLELGFAPLDLGSGTVLAVVDVPGHEGLVRTMVAGAAGIDLVLLVVAADEGVMPQTREHVAICDLLGVSAGLVVLTKADLVDAEVLALAAEEVRGLLAPTALAGAPVVAVSSTTGAGLPALRDALRDLVGRSAARTPRSGPPRLFADRAFEMRGFGAVLTGTLLGGPLAVGDAVELLPGGRRARIRGLQSFGRPAERVGPGARCAVNLQGVELGELFRGQQLTFTGALAETSALDVELVWLPSAPPLEDRVSVELLVGTAERRARLAPIGAEALAPGTRGLARLHVEGPPLALLPGDRIVVRGFARTALGATLGGGRVLDAAPPRRRRSDPLLAEELRRLAAGDAREGVRLRVARSGFAGRRPEDLARETGLGRDGLRGVLAALASEGDVFETPEGAWIGGEALAALERRLLGALARFHEHEPLRPGMPRAAARGALPENRAAGAFELAAARLAAAGRIEEGEGDLHLSTFVPRLGREEEALCDGLRAEYVAAGLEPPSLASLLASTGCEERTLHDLLAHLEREGSLVRAGELWFDRVAVDALRDRVVAHLRARGSLDTKTYKELIGASRKYAVPLMELFDAEHLTIRRGEERVLRRPGSPG
jgi:selenocysteine-specific elongation factor